MALSAYWDKFITDYTADDIYWYFPKGGTVDTGEFREKFRVFRSFEGQNWSPTLQAKFLGALHKAKLSVGKTLALTRIMKRTYENLGLCWVVKGKPIRITPAGRAYLGERGRSKVLDAHVWRYQLPNPLNDVRATKGISLFPHLVIVELLLACGNCITNDEFELFASRMKRTSELGKNVKRIRAWRRLKQDVQKEILNRLGKTGYKTIHENSGFARAFQRCDMLFERRTDRLSVTKLDVAALKQKLADHRGAYLPIEFEDKADAMAFYGDPEKATTKLGALEKYIDISDVKKAVGIFKRLPADVRGEMTPEEFEKSQILEKHLEEHLEKYLNKIEPGLKKLGRQYPTTVGPIDLFARAKNGDLVVIELKKGRAADKVFGQICRYMGCIQSERTRKGTAVRGYIVGRDIDQNLEYAVKVVAQGVIGLQTFEFKGEKGKHDWIKISAA